MTDIIELVEDLMRRACQLTADQKQVAKFLVMHDQFFDPGEQNATELFEEFMKTGVLPACVPPVVLNHRENLWSAP